jgi:hypothetical protein
MYAATSAGFCMLCCSVSRSMPQSFLSHCMRRSFLLLHLTGGTPPLSKNKKLTVPMFFPPMRRIVG